MGKHGVGAVEPRQRAQRSKGGDTLNQDTYDNGTSVSLLKLDGPTGKARKRSSPVKGTVGQLVVLPCVNQPTHDDPTHLQNE